MAFFITAWTALLWLASATGFDPTKPFYIPNQSIDLLVALGEYSKNWKGVERITSPAPINLTNTFAFSRNRLAYVLEGDDRDLRLPHSAFRQVSDFLLSSTEFTIVAMLKQFPRNPGTIVSFSHGANRSLEIQSSGRLNELRLYYTSGATAYSETFPYYLADDNWHKLAVTISGLQVEVFVDCRPLFKRMLKLAVPDNNFPKQPHLWIGQGVSRSFFKGILDELKVIRGPHGYLALCPHADSVCPTCGQFQNLEDTVKELSRHLKELSKRLVEAESRVSKLEECDCRIACHFNDTVHEDGAKWQTGCDVCSCVRGEVKCRPLLPECPKLPCKHPVNITGMCCPVCLRECSLQGKLYDHGEVVTIKKCTECTCLDGTMKCAKTEGNCPILNCPEEVQYSVPEQCCNMCPDTNECEREGGLDGHHCHQNTVCVNTPGSYVCQCLPGYRRIDRFNCAELDECSTGEHNCDVNARCINTRGSYHCACKEGYTGDGYTCRPVCEYKCINGGVCTSPGKCSCLQGYTGRSCELDLDECATDTHRCANSSTCVNKIGWYYCECKPGYKNDYKDNNLGLVCEDINECNSSLHTCHPSAQCRNTEGSYKCECPANRPDCKLSCKFEEQEWPDGWRGILFDKPCEECHCDRGVLSCEEIKCNCSLPNMSNNECCPQCNPRYSCRHQELSHVIFNHGDHWTFQCRTCECQRGEIDCTTMVCPPLVCNDPVKNPEDCCGHCEGDPCSFGGGNFTGYGQSCTYANRIIPSGSQFTDPNDRCTTCNCKDGTLCCHYNNLCGGYPEPVGYGGVVAAKNVHSTSDSDNVKQSNHRQLAAHSVGPYRVETERRPKRAPGAG